MAISKKIRFEVFKRDNFTCQYCGKKPPEVVLEIDHILPSSKKGTNEIENLLTSCFDCNRGKGDRKLTEPTEKIKINIGEIKEKSEQLEEFYKYQKTIEKLKEKQVKNIANYWSKLWNDKSYLSSHGENSIRQLLKRFSSLEIMEAIDISTRIKDDSRAFKYMCGVLWTKLKEKNG